MNKVYTTPEEFHSFYKTLKNAEHDPSLDNLTNLENSYIYRDEQMKEFEKKTGKTIPRSWHFSVENLRLLKKFMNWDFKIFKKGSPKITDAESSMFLAQNLVSNLINSITMNK